MAAKGILVGLGNPIMSDDVVGLWVSREVHKRLPGFELDLSCGSGFHVLDTILGYAMAVIVDAMVTGNNPPGTVVRVEMDSGLRTLRSGHSHGVSFIDAIQAGLACGAAVPETVVIYGIEVEDPYTVGEEVSGVVKQKIGTIVERILEDIASVRGERCTNSGSPPR